MLEGLRKMLDERKRKALEDAERFKAHDSDVCMLCDAAGEDKRSIWFSCFYDAKEAVPEFIDLTEVPVEKHSRFLDGYYLRVCKACRGALLGKMKEWANERRILRGLPKNHDGYLEGAEPTGPVAYTRQFGVCRPMTPEEIREREKTHQVVYYNPEGLPTD